MKIVPVANFSVSNLEGCSPLTIQFNNQSTDTINSVWNFGPGANILQNGSSPIVQYVTPGQYEAVLYITDTICGLTDTAKKVITVFPELTLEIPDDTIICDANASPFNLVANSFGTASQFIWADNIAFINPINNGNLDSVISISPQTEGIYYIKVSNGFPACDIIDSISVQLVSSAIEIQNSFKICLGDTIALIAKVADGINTVVDWSPNIDIFLENPAQNLALAAPLVSRYYYATANINGCLVEDSVFVNVVYIDPNSVNASVNPVEVAQGGSVDLIVTPNNSQYSYSWIPPELVINPAQRATGTIGLQQDTKFTAIVTDGTCTVRSSVFVKVLEFVCGDVYVFVPNAFSPNGDNQNDVVYVRGQNIESVAFKIFDRWGEKVFESNTQSDGWDGKHKGELLDPDVYVYHLKVVCVDGQENLIKGNITLLK